MKLNTVMRKRSDRLAGQIVGGMARYHMNNAEAAVKAGVSSRTFQSRKKEPMSLSLYELYKLCDALGLRIEIKEEDE